MDDLLMVTLLLWSSGLAEGQNTLTGVQCKTTAKADIVLLVDESGSISPSTFVAIQSFVAKLVGDFDIGPDRVQIGLVQYSDEPRNAWHLNTYQTKDDLMEAIYSLYQRAGGTNTGRALDYIHDISFSPSVGMREDSKKIAILITDGESQDNVRIPSQNLKEAGIEIFAIGVNDADETELRSIVSDPYEIHMYNVMDNSLLGIAYGLAMTICDSLYRFGLAEGQNTLTGVQCKTTAKADIVLLVDESGSISPSTFVTIQSFVAKLVGDFDIGPDRVQIGLVQYSDEPRNAWHLNTYQTKDSLLKAIYSLYQKGGGTNTGRALSYIQISFSPSVGTREDSKKIAILITDGESADNVRIPSQNLKEGGIEIFAIGVNDADETELRSIVSDPDELHMYNVMDNSLLGITYGLAMTICDSLYRFSAQCETPAKVDIVLLVDSSSSTGTIFTIITSFLMRVVSVFDIGPERVQIGLVQYSDDPTTVWHLNTYQTKHSLLQAINNLQPKYGDTYTGRALDYILHNNFKPNVGMRADSQKIAVLITDGQSMDATLPPSQNLKEAGIEVYTIGVNDASDSDLRSIASNPVKIHAYSVKDFLLLDIVDTLNINICNSANSLVFVRLVNRTSLCSGKLEVKANQSNQSNQRWSSVCEADFDQQDAEVVCRELGCGPPSVLQEAFNGEVEAPMWTKEFQCGGHESALLDCRSSGSDRNTCSSGRAVGLTCSEPVRLVGGSSRCAGALEVKQGDWRPVDGSDWTRKEAVAACRELGCGFGISARTRNESVHKSAWKISHKCIQSGYALRECATSGSSSSITEITCLVPVRLVGRHTRCAGTLEVRRGDWRPVDGSDWTLKEAAATCRELDCASVVSAGTRTESVHKSAWKISRNCIQSGYTLRECATSGFSSSIMEITCLDSIRLGNGTSLCSGRLEVKSDKWWYPVCEADFDQQDAEVVCRELGCGAPSVLQGARYEEAEAPVWPKKFHCGGNESALLDCRSSGSERNTCSPGKAVGLTCSEPVRLVGGSTRCAGALEVKLGDWRPVDGSDWILKEAAAACGELDCGSAVSTGTRNESVQKSAWKISPNCIQSGSALRECATAGSSSSIMEITCSDSIRLVNGTSLCSGRLEVKSNQSNQSNQRWSSVCEADFDQQDAEVVCRELGCGAPSVLQGALYEEAEAPVWTKEFQCGGHESALLDCRSSERNTCSPGKAVGLTCSEPVRLVGGSSRCTGALEVKLGDWRPVDGSDWTLTLAAAACRELDCGPAVSAGRREDSSNRSAWRISSDCVQSGSALRECVTSFSWSPSILELTCSHPADFIIRLIVLPLILLLVITVMYFIFKPTRGQKLH